MMKGQKLGLINIGPLSWSNHVDTVGKYGCLMVIGLAMTLVLFRQPETRWHFGQTLLKVNYLKCTQSYEIKFPVLT